MSDDLGFFFMSEKNLERLGVSEPAKNREALASPSCMLEDKARNRIALTVKDAMSVMQLSQSA